MYKTIFVVSNPNLPHTAPTYINHEWGKEPPTVKEERAVLDTLNETWGPKRVVDIFIASFEAGVYRWEDPKLKSIDR